MSWQPISTAPKDDGNVDLWHHLYGRLTDCCWRRGRWHHWALDDFDGMNWVSIDYPNQITHWMPLPEPPEQARNETD